MNENDTADEKQSMKAWVEKIIEEEKDIERALRDKQIEYADVYDKVYDNIIEIITNRAKLVHDELIMLHELARLLANIESHAESYAKFSKKVVHIKNYKNELQAWADEQILRDIDINRELINKQYEYVDNEKIFEKITSILLVRSQFVGNDIALFSIIKKLA